MSIDTLEYAKRLEAAGISRAQAEAHAEALKGAVSTDLATKADLSQTETALRADIGRLEQKLDAKFLLLQWMLGFALAALMPILWRLLR